jgi:3-ketosteroid 9alpha-monooxygenase subunit A
MVADASKVTATPLSVRFFANDMVLYRGESGRVVMLDAYCPHMKTHLGCNTTRSFVVTEGRHVEGDSIRCPYHAWRFGPDGMCDDIPYFDKIPAAAKVRSWTVREADGMVFVWHDPEGLEADFDLPVLPEWDEAGWIRWTVSDYGTMNTHPVEFLDNLADIAHLSPIHGTTAVRLENEISGVYASQRSSQYLCNAASTEPSYVGNTYYTGPSIATTRSNSQQWQPNDRTDLPYPCG